jgi:NAD(P)H-hydrate epimerase
MKDVYLSRRQVREVDRRAIEEFHVPGIVLMENAARGVVAVAEEMLRGSGARRVLVLCGGGNNGGDGLAVARHLHNHGYDPSIGLCTEPGKYKGDALINWEIVRAMRLPCFPATAAAIVESEAALVVDGIFGTGLAERPREDLGPVVEALERLGAPMLAIDVPSGMDCDTGAPLGACVRATRTVTFVAMKRGFRSPASKRYTGEVTVAEIGCPRVLIDAVREGEDRGGA